MFNFQRTKDLLEKLNRYRNEIDLLFSRRSQNVTVESFLAYLERIVGQLPYSETPQQRLEQLKNYGFVEVDSVNNVVYLNSHLREFISKFTNVAEEINNLYIKGKIENLKNNVDYFMESPTSASSYNYLAKIRDILRDITRDVQFNALALQQMVEDTYKTEPVYSLKLRKLKDFDYKLKDLQDLINEFWKYLRSSEWQMFKSVANDSVLENAELRLHQSFIDSEDVIIRTLNSIVEFLFRYKIKNQQVETIRRLKELKDLQEIEYKTNILDVLRGDKAIVWEPIERQSLPLDLEPLQDPDSPVQEIVKKVALAAKHKSLKSARKVNNVRIDSVELDEKHVEFIDYQGLWQDFIKQDSDLWSFLSQSERLRHKHFEEILDIYAKLVSYNFQKLRFLGYLQVGDFYIAKAIFV